MTNTIKTEQNLSWLQEFYATNIRTLGFDLPEFISDAEIEEFGSFFKDTFSKVGVLKIYNLISGIGHFGWSLEFFHKKVFFDNYWTDIKVNDTLKDNDDWVVILKTKKTFDCASGPLYLTVIFEAFKYWIEGIKFIADNLQILRDDLKIHNVLLTWLEDFYFSCCEGEWPYMYGFDLISTKTGWVMFYSLNDLIHYEEEAFDPIVIHESEGTIQCYKKGGNFIIRAHPRGLIKGLTIFRDWIKSVDEIKAKEKEEITQS